MSVPRIVISGLGFLTSIGNDRAAVSTSRRELRTGIERHEFFAGADLPVKVAGTIKGFARLRHLLRREGVELTIVSDNFDLILAPILRRTGFADVACRANHLELAAERLWPSFPFGNPDCPVCAHCKKTHFLPPNDDARQVIFIGDGRSDICPSLHADIVFAKDSLLAHLQAARIPCVAYRDLTQVAGALEKHLHAHQN